MQATINPSPTEPEVDPDRPEVSLGRQRDPVEHPRDADLAGAVLRILLRVIRGELRDSVRGPLPSDARLGAVSFLHRFGSGLNPHPHFHLAVTDGLFAREHGEDGGALHFHPAVGLDAERARALTPIVQRRVLRLYVRRGLLSETDAEDMLGWRGTGGFSLDGSVRIAAHDRAGPERLLRGHRREALVVLDRPSRCIASARSRRGCRSTRPTRG